MDSVLMSELMAELPDLFRFENGAAVMTQDDWTRRRNELLSAILDIEYGQLPPAPPSVTGEELHSHTVEALGGARHSQYRLVIGSKPPFPLYIDVLVPPGDGPFSVVVYGDGCWRYVTEDITRAVLQRGNILVQFNRTAIVPDNGNGGRTTGLYDIYADGTFGALAAWAWGYHRCVDFLCTLSYVDAARIAITGHSRGERPSCWQGPPTSGLPSPRLTIPGVEERAVFAGKVQSPRIWPPS